jgi:hypothetical protein
VIGVSGKANKGQQGSARANKGHFIKRCTLVWRKFIAQMKNVDETREGTGNVYDLSAYDAELMETDLAIGAIEAAAAELDGELDDAETAAALIRANLNHKAKVWARLLRRREFLQTGECVAEAQANTEHDLYYWKDAAEAALKGVN